MHGEEKVETRQGRCIRAPVTEWEGTSRSLAE